MTEARTENNTRGYRRRTVRILVDYASDSGVHCDYATTLGAGGIFLESEEPQPAGSVLKMRFRLPSAEVLHEIEGKVNWTRIGADRGEGRHAPGMGIQFTDPVSIAKLARELEDLD